MKKPILCIDFDGVIHDYKEGWKDGSIYGKVVDGFFEWAEKAQKHFRLVIYSSRSKTREGKEEMERWLYRQYNLWKKEANDTLQFEFSNEKPPAFLTIDDRAIQFRGNWNTEELNPEELKKFKPWNIR
jgi:hypothetical protein